MGDILDGFGAYGKIIVAALLILALLGLIAWLLRQFGSAGLAISAATRSRQPRLAVLDSATVDSRRKLVLIRRDNVEHLLLIGGPTDVVVEMNIVRAVPLGATAARPALRSGASEPAETETALAPLGEIAQEELERPMPIAPVTPPVRTPAPAAPRIQPQLEPQYADMAKRLELALAKPAVEPAVMPTLTKTEPRPLPVAPSFGEPRFSVPHPPKPSEPKVSPAPAARAPEPPRPSAPEPRPAAPTPKSGSDPFQSLEEEMASLLRPSGRPS
jgi:hypothetical protein